MACVGWIHKDGNGYKPVRGDIPIWSGSDRTLEPNECPNFSTLSKIQYDGKSLAEWLHDPELDEDGRIAKVKQGLSELGWRYKTLDDPHHCARTHWWYDSNITCTEPYSEFLLHEIDDKRNPIKHIIGDDDDICKTLATKTESNQITPSPTDPAPKPNPTTPSPTTPTIPSPTTPSPTTPQLPQIPGDRTRCQIPDDLPERSKTFKDRYGQIPVATMLSSEFLNLEDLDGNGYVFGYDFNITEDCFHEPPCKPTILIALKNVPEWKQPEVCVDWFDFLRDVYVGNSGLTNTKTCPPECREDGDYNIHLIIYTISGEEVEIDFESISDRSDILDVVYKEIPKGICAVRTGDVTTGIRVIVSDDDPESVTWVIDGTEYTCTTGGLTDTGAIIDCDTGDTYTINGTEYTCDGTGTGVTPITPVTPDPGVVPPVTPPPTEPPAVATIANKRFTLSFGGASLQGQFSDSFQISGQSLRVTSTLDIGVSFYVDYNHKSTPTTLHFNLRYEGSTFIGNFTRTSGLNFSGTLRIGADTSTSVPATISC